MKRILPILLVLVVAAAGYAVWTQRSANVIGGGLGGSGTIEATNVTVSSQASGRITTAFVRAGDSVKKGEVLFRLDPTMALYQIDQAQAGVRAAQATLDQDENDGKSDAQIAQDKAQRDQAKIAVDMARAQLGYYTIKSPLAGVALDVPGTAGENATPGGTLAVLGDTSHLQVSIYVPESQIGQVKVGREGALTTDSSSGRFACRVTSVASQAEFTPASVETKDQRVKLVYEVRLDLSDKTGTLKPGMPVDVTL
jgi:HlyD family secretion protein